MTLVIMAAGMGSRYGSLKQADPIGPNGEFIIDYSIFDAIKAGFDHLVFIIKQENHQLFRETVGKRVEKCVHVDYAFQRIEDIPDGCAVNVTRSKPWGTAHAVYSCAGLVKDNFMVINADDFYGRTAFALMGDFFRTNAAQNDKGHFCMVGFQLKNTITENGHVSRGICEVSQGYLNHVTERTKIQRIEGETAFYEEPQGWTPVDQNAVVSMNCWGFTPAVFGYIKDGWEDFLHQSQGNLEKAEYFLPSVVQQLIDRGQCDVKVLQTADKWYGVTYHEDRGGVQEVLKRMIKRGVYPERLWDK